MKDDEIEAWIDAAIEADPEIDITEFDDSAGGPPLSTDEIVKAHDDLCRWQSPKEFRELVRQLHQRCRSAELFNNPQHNFLLDAFTLAEFVRHKPVNTVRLTCRNEQWPDGQVEIDNKVENVEVTIALARGRKLGAEYRFAGPAELDPVDSWIERADQIPEALEKAVRRKADKQYSSPMWIVVYLNINEFGIRQAETEEVIANIKQRYSASFTELYVLWKDKLL
jgi:hypothetical protein